MQNMDALRARFTFREVRPEEAEETGRIESICFPPNEACSMEHMRERVLEAPELFLVAEEKETGRMAGFLNGLSTNETRFRDEFFTEIALYDPKGSQVMLLGLDVLPDFRRQGLATQLVREYAERERAKGRKRLVLTCLEDKVEMYRKMGFADLGMANSSWGGEAWHEMDLKLV